MTDQEAILTQQQHRHTKPSTFSNGVAGMNGKFCPDDAPLSETELLAWYQANPVHTSHSEARIQCAAKTAIGRSITSPATSAPARERTAATPAASNSRSPGCANY
jgi:hypothetical protein